MAPRHRAPPKLLRADRVRTTQGGFAFLPNRFLHHGFLGKLTPTELALYVFLVLAADRRGLSYYSYDRICQALHITLDAYVEARDALIQLDLIAFDGTLFQVLSLPSRPQPRRTDARTTNAEPRTSPAASTPTSLEKALRALLDEA